ncbi:MAG: glycosyltransferase family 4 protein [Planctomycetales bacterium]|nr:glycosyltransferase family 4 protein [Planctomycetales bacterium]
MTKRRPATLMLIENSPYSQDGRVRRESQALLREGWDVYVICPRAKYQRRYMNFDGVHAYQYTQREFGSGFVAYVVEYGYAMTMASLLSLWIWLRRGFQVVHAHNPPDFFVVIGLFYKLFGKKFIFDHHDLAPDMYDVRFGERARPTVAAVMRFFERLSCRIADQVIATNGSYRQVEIERCGISADKITIVRNGPEPRHFERVAPHPFLADRPEYVIGYVGEMGKQDGVDYLIRALGKLQTTRDDWYCVIIGDGEMVESLERLANDLGIGERTSFVGRVSHADVVPYLSGMDICTVPDPSNSYNDRCTMIKVMEYMAQSKPIIAFDLPETRYSAGESARYIVPNDEAKFAAALSELMDDPSLRESMGKRGRDRAAAELAWEHAVPHLLSVYRRILPGAVTSLEPVGLAPRRRDKTAKRPAVSQLEK